MANYNTKHNYLELLVEAAIEAPTKPGCFTLDSQALRTLLYELVRQQKLGSRGSDSSLKEANEKMMQDLNGLKFLVNQIEKKMDQMGGLGDSVSRLETMLLELRENERIISESTNLLMADVEATQEHLEALQKGIFSSDGKEPVCVGELLERIEVLEASSGSKKKQLGKRASTSMKQYQLPSTPQRKSFVKHRISLVDDSRFSKSSILEKIVEPMPTEPISSMAKPFLELKESIQQLGMVYTTAAEDFLTFIKANDSVQPKLLQELMIIFGSMEVNFFNMLVHSMNVHPSLTIPAFTEILDMLLTSPSNAQAMVSLYSQMSTTPPKLDIEAFCAMLQCVRDVTKVTPKGLCEVLHILINCEGLMDFLKEMTELESWSWQSMLDILEELHFSKNSTLMELVVVMQKMSESELNELMSMLLTIPGYVNELILSLPHTPSLSTQRVLEHLISLPGDAPKLLAQAVALMDKSHLQKENILRAVRRFLELTARLESDSRSADNGFYHLLKMLHKAENISLENFGEVLSLLSFSENFNMEAVRFLVQFSRDSPHDFLGALKGLLMAVASCPNINREQIRRAIRLLEKAKFVTPRNTEQLLTIMQKSGLLRQQIFDPVREAFQKSELNNAYNLCEFYTMVKQLDFLTLEDLGHVLEQNQANSRRAYEEALERYTWRLQEIKDAEEREAARLQEEDICNEEEGEDELEEKDLSKKETTSDLSPTTSTSQIFSKAQSHSLHEQQVSGVDAAQIQEMQKEIRELYNVVTALQEEKPRKTIQEKDKKKRTVKPRRRVKKYLDVEVTPPCPPPVCAVRKSSSSPTLEEGSVETSSEREPEQQFKPMEDTTSQNEESGASLVMHSSCMMLEAEMKEEVTKLRETIEQLSEHEKECEQRYQWLSEIVSLKAESEQLSRFQDAVKRQLHNFVHKIPPGPAGAKQHLPVNCLSCDSKKVLSTEPVGKSLPMTGAFPPVLSQRPHRVYEMDLIRRHARSLMEGRADRGDLYSIPRACGGEHTSVDVRQTWTYEIHQKETCTRSADGRVYNNTHNKAKSNGTKTRTIVYLPHPPTDL